MHRTTKISKAAPRPRRAERVPLKTVIVYDGFADLIRAYEMWAAIVARLKDKIQIVSSAWDFTGLRDPRLRRQAALNTASANVIVLSASGQSELPVYMLHWINSWLPWKKGRRAALVAVLDQQAPLPPAAAHLRNYLRRSAEQAGMDFFCNTDDGRMRMEAGAGV